MNQRKFPQNPQTNPKKLNEKREPVEREVSAGGIVFMRSGSKILVAMMKDTYGKWTFPKGHVEKGEAIEEAAARETLEELGLEEIRLIEPLGKIDIWFRDQYKKKGRMIHKDIHYFLFEARPGAQLHVDPSEHVLEAKWTSVGVILKESNYPDLVPILHRALGFLKAIHK